MKRTHIIALASLVALAAATFGVAFTGAGGFAIDWDTIDGGGGQSSGGTFALQGTIGQHDAGGPMTGAKFALTGGFWAGVASAPGAPCPADLDGDGSVGVSDLLELLASWGPCKGCPADFDGNGDVGVSDLLTLLANWGPCP